MLHFIFSSPMGWITLVATSGIFVVLIGLSIFLWRKASGK